MHVQIVNFNLKAMSDVQFRQACDEQFAPAFAHVPGLMYKLWLADPDTNTYGGVYAWRDNQAMKDFLNSELFKTVASHPNFSDMTSKDFGILEGPTRVTNGLTAASV
jgi:hypothetical protein